MTLSLCLVPSSEDQLRQSKEQVAHRSVQVVHRGEQLGSACRQLSNAAGRLRSHEFMLSSARDQNLEADVQIPRWARDDGEQRPGAESRPVDAPLDQIFASG
jgi:hypothetical protein